MFSNSNNKITQIIRILIALALLVFTGSIQWRLVTKRGDLGLTRVEPLKNAPPVIAFTTVALGGFRGLITNALWIRAVDLQDQGKYFEMIQLADWITKLQPQFKSVWVHQAWNLVYNISIKFNDPEERWRWVLAGIQLLRDEALKYNPVEPTIYRELAWFFQHKIGFYLDDAHMFYKAKWAKEFSQAVPNGKPNYDSLLNPKTESDKAQLNLLTKKFKMDPKLMKEVDEKYGPLDWRLPEAHAIYWATLGLKNSKKEDLIVLRRVIYQSMQLAFYRGRLIENPYDQTFQLGPNLQIIDKVNKAYLEMAEQDPEYGDHIKKVAYKNFLRDAVYFLYCNNRISAAQHWFDYLCKTYPKDTLIIGDLTSYPDKVNLEQYVIARVEEDLKTTSPDRTKTIIEGLLTSYYYYLALGENDTAAGYGLLARKVWNKYNSETSNQKQRLGLPDFPSIQKDVLDRLLNSPQGFSRELAAQLRTVLNLPAPSVNTNAIPGQQPPTTTIQTNR